jgi:hypothetical protein
LERKNEKTPQRPKSIIFVVPEFQLTASFLNTQ